MNLFECKSSFHIAYDILIVLFSVLCQAAGRSVFRQR